MEKIRIAVDAMGGDYAPSCIVKGAVQAACDHAQAEVLLVGKPEEIEPVLAGLSFPEDRVRVIPASEVITTNEHPMQALRAKKDSSLVVAMKLVRSGDADAVISAGSSGAVLGGGMLLVGRIRGVERPPFAVLMPTEKGVCLLADAGANLQSRPSHLLQYAQMGSIYMEHVLGIPSPRVGIVNIGVEEEKGDSLVQETLPLLRACDSINFIGSIESRDIPKGIADVVICDAFVGNAMLKLFEGVADTLIREIKKAMLTDLRSKIGALLVKPAIKKKLATFSADEYGGAPMLGLKGLVVKTHGNAKEKVIYNAVVQCIRYQEQHIGERISEHLRIGAEEENADA